MSAERVISSKGDSAKSFDEAVENDENGLHCQPVFNPDEWITKAEAARIRGVSRQAIGKLARKGKFATFEIAGNVLLKKKDVEGYQPEPGGRPSEK